MFTRDDWDPGDMMNGSADSGVAMWVVLGLFVVVAVGVAALFLLRASARGQTDASPTTVAEASSPRQLLDRRLARGEIDAEEYTAARTLLDH